MGWKKGGYPEQHEVRQALKEYAKKYSTFAECAEHIGICAALFNQWRTGVGKIPDWMCEHLGFRREVRYVRIGGPVGVTTTEKSA